MAHQANDGFLLEDLLGNAQLPALPQSAIRLLQLSQDPDNGPAEYAVPIESDPGLTGQVLKFVNSSYFGFSREISSVRLAINLVGIRTIKNFALWNAVFSLMPNPRCGPFDLKSLWQDSLRRALFARACGKMLGLRDAEDVFAAALLQDMAVPLLAKELPEEYAELILARREGVVRLSDLERQKFGWTHADAAGAMARKWSLPEELASLVERHVEMEQWLGLGRAEPAKVAVCLSASLPSAADDQWAEHDLLEGAFEALRQPDSPTLEAVFAKVDEGFAEFAPLLRLGKPARTLVESLHGAAIVT